jgi:hypothetical protein
MVARSCAVQPHITVPSPHCVSRWRKVSGESQCLHLSVGDRCILWSLTFVLAISILLCTVLIFDDPVLVFHVNSAICCSRFRLAIIGGCALVERYGGFVRNTALFDTISFYMRSAIRSVCCPTYATSEMYCRIYSISFGKWAILGGLFPVPFICHSANHV